MEAFENRLRKNQRHFGKWARKREIEAYRIYDHDIPNVPAIVERYGDAAVLWHVHRFEEDAERGPEVEEAALHALNLPRENLYIKYRQRQSGTIQYEKLQPKGATGIVQEGDMRFRVNLSDYLDTGLFLDQRSNRSWVHGEAKGLDVLNLFAYTGSFSVAAGKGGAKSVTTVDLSNTYLGWTEENLELNGLDPGRHDLVQDDTFNFLRDGPAEGRRYDLVICDPPTFSNSKRMVGTLDIQRDHPGLIDLIMKVLRPGGRLLFSTNRSRFKLEARLEGALNPEVLSPRCIPDDVRNKKAFQAWLFQA